MATTELEKNAAKQVIRQLVGKRLSPGPIAGSNKKSLDACLRRWENPVPKALDVEWIYRFRQSHETCETEFEKRLLEEKLAAMKQLAYGASHEINNPLANISTRAQTLMVEESDPERRRKLAVIYEQALRAHEMISDMMLFANPPKLVRAATDVRLLIAKLAKEIAGELGRGTPGELQLSPPIELEVRIGPDIKDVMIDATQICVALKALIRNSIEAIRSAGRPGKIGVRVGYRADQIWFTITDNGVGISSATKRHLFDPFYSGREAGRGLGFGLSKAWRIARLHGGTLWYDEDWADGLEENDRTGADLGARFILSLPSERLIIPRISRASVA